LSHLSPPQSPKPQQGLTAVWPRHRPSVQLLGRVRERPHL
jgi:hypothetical protein